MKKYVPILSILNVFILTMCTKVVVPTKVDIEVDDVENNYSIHTNQQKEFLSTEDLDAYIESDIRVGRRSLSNPNPLHLSWDETNDIEQNADRYEILVSEDNSFTNPIKYTSNNKELDIYNLKINTDYYFRVDSIHHTSSYSSDVFNYKVNDTAPRNLYVDGVENVRDLGGWVLDNGKTYKQGLIYRTAQFNYGGGLNTYKSAPTELGLSTLLNELKVKTDIDLRKTKAFNGEDEVNSITSSPLGSSVNYVSAPMRFNGENIFTQDINKESIRLFFSTLSDINNYPIAFHCLRGTDRTGALAYVLGALVGMNKEQLKLDYLFSDMANIGNPVFYRNICTDSFYVYGIDNSIGDSLSEKAKNYLINTCNVSSTVIESVIDILSE